jgi:hypothetical protein
MVENLSTVNLNGVIQLPRRQPPSSPPNVERSKGSVVGQFELSYNNPLLELGGDCQRRNSELTH